MSFEWDEAKRQKNMEKHGIDFTQVETFEWETAYQEPSIRDGETRTFALGYIGNRLHALVFVRRGTNIRVISLRKAHPKEESRYAAS